MPSSAPSQLVLGGSDRGAFTRRLARTIARNLAPHDVVVLCFELYLWLRALLAPLSDATIYARNVSFGLLASSAIAIGLCRGELLPAGPGRALLHRLGLCLPLAGVYLALRRYLPALAIEPRDAALLALDRRLFGETPAVLLERFASPRAVEWFAFCYYAYFFLLGGYLLLMLADRGNPRSPRARHRAGCLEAPISSSRRTQRRGAPRSLQLRDRGARAAELTLGIALVTALGQSLYTLVPGYGPHASPALFAQPLHGGAYFARVLALVARAGAELDIFPSLHTAHPVFLALHALRHRRGRAYRWLWLPTALLAANMVIATMFLRWHYGVDVLAGLLLALGAQRIAIATVRMEATRSGRQPAWEPLVR